MKRSLGVTLVVGGLLLALFTMRLGSQRQMMAMEDARAAEQRAQTLVDAPPPLPQPGEQGRASVASPPKIPDEINSQIRV